MQIIISIDYPDTIRKKQAGVALKDGHKVEPVRSQTTPTWRLREDQGFHAKCLEVA